MANETTPAFDPKQAYLKVFKKDGTFVAAGDKGTLESSITGVSKGAKIASGDYVGRLSYDNSDKVSYADSDPVDVPAFTANALVVPDAPTIAVTAGDGKVTVAITPGASDGEPGNSKNDLTKFTVSYKTSAGSENWATKDTADGNTTSLDITGLTNGTEYQFKAVAVNATGNSADSAVVKVTPKAATVAVTGVTMAPKTASVEVGKTTQLAATIAPDNATDKAVAWSSSDESIATVDNSGKVTGVKAGKATITAASHADGTKKDTAEITVTAAS